MKVKANNLKLIEITIFLITFIKSIYLKHLLFIIWDGFDLIKLFMSYVFVLFTYSVYLIGFTTHQSLIIED